MTDYKRVFAENLKYQIEKSGKTQAEICDDLDFSEAAMSTWVNGTKDPRTGAKQKLADYFKIGKSDLTEQRDRNERESLKNLVSVCKNLCDDDIETLITLAEKFCKINSI